VKSPESIDKLRPPSPTAEPVPRSAASSPPPQQQAASRPNVQQTTSPRSAARNEINRANNMSPRRHARLYASESDSADLSALDAPCSSPPTAPCSASRVDEATAAPLRVADGLLHNSGDQDRSHRATVFSPIPMLEPASPRGAARAADSPVLSLSGGNWDEGDGNSRHARQTAVYTSLSDLKASKTGL
jgi:hypothetical protein